jgi:hypothetical protein
MSTLWLNGGSSHAARICRGPYAVRRWRVIQLRFANRGSLTRRVEPRHWNGTLPPGMRVVLGGGPGTLKVRPS